MIKERLIECNSSSEILLSNEEKTNGVRFILQDESHTKIAQYDFYANKVLNVKSIKYKANNVKIKFEEITPSAKSELCSAYE